MQTGDLIAFITYAMVIIMGCLIMGMVSIMLPRADVAAQRLSEVLATEPTVRDPEAPIHVRSDAASGARIAFNDVSFRYTDDGDPALSHVSFVAEPGTTLAIVGPTGSGKSTIVKLIERFYDPTAGSVTLDGVDLRELSQADLRANLGYVPQKAFLFEGTVESNIAYGDRGRRRGGHSRRPGSGLRSGFRGSARGRHARPIAQGGDNVSGGQRQRLAMAAPLCGAAGLPVRRLLLGARLRHGCPRARRAARLGRPAPL